MSRRSRSVLGAVLVAAATAALYVVSRGKWSDALIDSGREWIVPDALARGGLLYRDVVYWFGPFTPYFQAAFLRVLGSGFPALVAAGAAAAMGVLAALYIVLRRLGGRNAAFLWTVLAIPVLVFMPNAGGALLGMGYRIWHAAGFALAAVALASGRPGSRRVAWMAAAGICAGLAGLCRTEWGLAAVAGAMLAALVRPRRRGEGLRDALVVAAGGAAVFAGGLGYFVQRAGRAAVLGDGHVLLTGLPPETRHFLVAFSGIRDWRSGTLELLYSAAMWLGLFALVAWFARPASAGRSRTLAVMLASVLAVLAVTAILGGAGGAVLFSAAPLLCVTGLAAGLWRRRGSGAAALAGCGFLGALLSYRRPFHIGDSAYVAPPLLFAFACAAGLLRLAAASERRAAWRKRLCAAFQATVTVLVVAAFAARSWQYAAIESVPIAGTNGMLSAGESTAVEIEELARAVQDATKTGQGLVVFPEGELLNLLAERSNPIRHMLYLPGYLTADNEPKVLDELARARPAAIVVWRRPVTEYDRALFGEDFGERIRAWIDAGYVRAESPSSGPRHRHGRFTLYVRRE